MDLVAPVGPVYQAGTLSANPVAMMAGLAMLKKLKRDNPYAKLEKRVEDISKELEAIAKKADVQLKVQRFASMFWTIFGDIGTRDGFVRNPLEIPAVQKERYAKGFHELLKRGIYCAPSGYEVSFVSTAHEDAHYEKFLKAFGEAIRP
jgi:glutamate-1-semialdehyde 2,1-aminomutase